MSTQLPAMLDALAAQGWAQMPLAIDRSDCLKLIADLEKRYANGLFQSARIGQGKDNAMNKIVRSDTIDWIGSDDPELSVKQWLKEIEELTGVLNENFFLSLNSFDCHFACYEPGGFYLKHLDRFRGDPDRKLSVILFLNEGWRAEEEGELLIYDPIDTDKILAEVIPEMGTLVIFQSDTVLHEVRATKRRRISLSGWLKSRPGLENETFSGEN